MRKTSIDAYKEILHKIPKSQLEVLAHIELKRDYGATLFELVNFMKKPVNQLSGRVTELNKQEMIKENGRRVNPLTGKRGTVWIINEEKKYESS
jgi:hypothetical protein